MTATSTPEQLEHVKNRAKSVGDMFYSRVRETGHREAFRFPDANEDWHSVTWAQAGVIVSEIAAGLVSLGIQAEERVAIAAGTRIEWIYADLGINSAGAATTTVYPSTVADDTAYILADSDSRIVFAEDDVQIAKLKEKKSELPSVIKVVTFDGTTDGDWIISLDDLRELGKAHLEANPTVVDDRLAATGPESLATLIYTSGTTGRPKGVRLTHDSSTYEGAAIASRNILSPSDLEFRWLPMAHSFAKVLMSLQLQVGFAAAIDGRVPKIVENLAIVRPTFMGAAPRIFEKAYGRIVGMMEEDGGVKLKLFNWAQKVGVEHSRLERAGKPIPAGLKIQYGLADKIIFSKIRDRFGGRVRFFISGAAALSPDIAEWFHAANVLILEGYGLTESSAGTFVNVPDNFKIGSVGIPMPGTEVKIAEDGEVLLRGPGVMSGYHNLDAETAAALSEDKWLATGDIGRVDEDGFLWITDRKKDLFKTSVGKYVAPSHIEGIFKGVCPLASQMIVHGNERKFCSALITLDPDAVTAWADSNGMSGKSYTEVVSSPEIAAIVGADVEELNGKLNPWETIKKWAILDNDLTVESGEITPSLKVKRRVVEDNYRAILDGFYA
ncbi:MAG: long-chain fatty acid--CoA ligase [Actinomycetales bacterium]|nr:long-chain fatty acid--CoA ligase [Actinomycetales bacterium]